MVTEIRRKKGPASVNRWTIVFSNKIGELIAKLFCGFTAYKIGEHVADFLDVAINDLLVPRT
jgi:hypothetical protein